MTTYRYVYVMEIACACVAVYRRVPLPASTYLAELSNVRSVSNWIDSSRLSQILRTSNIFNTTELMRKHAAYALKPSVFEHIAQSPNLEKAMCGVLTGANRQSFYAVRSMLAEAIKPLGRDYALWQPPKDLKPKDNVDKHGSMRRYRNS